MRHKILFTFFYLFITNILTHADLYINEVNSTGKWIEIYNSGATAVDVSGYTVTRFNNDFSDNTATIPAGATITANGFLVLYQDGAGSPVAGAIACLPYGISTDKFWSATLKDEKGTIVDETFDVGFPQMVIVTEGKSWARGTDGGAAIVALDPTPGKSNTSPPLQKSELKIFINEVNSTGKWIEIFNDENKTVDMGGYTIARYNNDNAIAQIPIPAGTTIAAKGFIVLYQGEAAPTPTAGAVDCLTYGISSDKFWYLSLKDNEGRIVDNTFNIGNPQTVTVTSGKSWARETDASETIVALDPTPGKSNISKPEFSTLKIYINEVNSSGKWIEIYNDEEEDVDLDGYTVTRNNNDGAIGLAVIPEGTTLTAKGFLTIYQGGAAPSPVKSAIDCMPYGISADKFLSAILKDDQGRIVDNTFDIGNPQTVTVSGNKSWARETDGAAIIVALDPTPGKSNTSDPDISELTMYINEVNPFGKWIEIYNDTDDDIEIGGFSVVRINDDDASGTAILPEGTIITAKGYLVIYQGGIAPSPVEGAIDCLPYGISAEKFVSAIFKDDEGRLIDIFAVGNPHTVTVSEGESWARETDGAETIVASEPTPGLNNDVTSGSIIFTKEKGPVYVYGRTLFLSENISYIQLYSIMGHPVLNRSVTGISIDLTNIPQGIYIVRYTVSGKLFAKKIVLNY